MKREFVTYSSQEEGQARPRGHPRRTRVGQGAEGVEIVRESLSCGFRGKERVKQGEQV